MKQSGKIIAILCVFLQYPVWAQKEHFPNPVRVLSMYAFAHQHFQVFETSVSGTDDPLYQWKLITETDKKAKSKNTKTVLTIAQVAVGALAVALTYPEIKELGRMKQVQKYGPYRGINHDIFNQAVRTNIFIGAGVGISVSLALIRKKL